MGFAFHAAPPGGEWVNDPNGLVFVDGRYRLFVQHGAQGPDYKSIGWARLSSDDLITWEWDGSVIPPDRTGFAYSGSVTLSGKTLAAWLTRHDNSTQRQYRLIGTQAGTCWQQDPAPLGPEGRNIRDPFVFDEPTGGRRQMLLAEPCDWNDWRMQPASRLSVWAEIDGSWQQVGAIGPWSPAGVMWEVPVLLAAGGLQYLIVSMIDRREGNALCSVHVWRGIFDGSTFVPDDTEGELLDYGPDFYATCVNTPHDWPLDKRVLVAWASNWSTARTIIWPGDVRGGAMTLPRVVQCRDGRLRQSPLPTARGLATTQRWEPGRTLALDFDGRFELHISSAGIVTARRSAPVWTLAAPLVLAIPTVISIFEDHGLLEVFFEAEGQTMTVFIGEREQ